MAVLGDIFGHSIIFAENYRVKTLNPTLIPVEDVVITLDNGETQYSGTTNSDGYVDFLVDTTESTSYEITYTPTEDSGYHFGTYQDTFNGLDGNLYEIELTLTIPPSISGEPSSKYNFIRWHYTEGLYIANGTVTEDDFVAIDQSVDSYIDCSDLTTLPNNYIQSKDFYYQPPFINGDTVRIVINFNLGFASIDPAENYNFAIVNNSGDVLLNNIDYNFVLENGEFNFWFELEDIDLYVGNMYRFAFMDTDNLNVLYFSNPFRVESSDNLLCYPQLVYSNSCNMFDFLYTGSGNLYNQLRVDFNKIDEQPEIEMKQYREQSTGKLRNQKTQTAKTMKIETFMFDRGANDAMFALSVHDDITLNGRTMEVKTPHKVTYNKLQNKFKGEIELYNQEDSTINLHG